MTIEQAIFLCVSHDQGMRLDSLPEALCRLIDTEIIEEDREEYAQLCREKVSALLMVGQLIEVINEHGSHFFAPPNKSDEVGI